MDKKKILEFIHHSERLKDELRHNWTSKDRQESVAEHSWRLAILAILFNKRLERKIDMEKVLKMIAIHDFGEIAAGDVPAFDEKAKQEQVKIEKESMEKLNSSFNLEEVEEIVELWKDLENLESLEAKFVKALDKMEVRIQHNESKMRRWNDIEFLRSQYVADKWCEYDNFLKELNELIKKESKEKIKKESDKDIREIEKQAEEMKKG